MRVKSCVASDGGGHIIQLSDEFGCVLRPKMISRFLKARGADERASVITYAFFHAFKFPDALSVHIKCKVEICRHGCLDHCQIQAGKGDLESDLVHYVNPLERKDVNEKSASEFLIGPDPVNSDRDIMYEDIVQEGDGGAAIGANMAPIKMPLNGGHIDRNKQTLKTSESEDTAEGEDTDEDISGTAVSCYVEIKIIFITLTTNDSNYNFLQSRYYTDLFIV